MKKRRKLTKHNTQRTRGIVCVEYILLITIVGIGLVVGMTVVRGALVSALKHLAYGIRGIVFCS